MKFWQLIPCLFAASSLVLAEDELPLPVFGPLPERAPEVQSQGLLSPTAVIKPPTSGPILVTPEMIRPTVVIKPPPADAPVAVAPVKEEKEVLPHVTIGGVYNPGKTPRELAQAEIERRNQEKAIRQQIAEAHVNGSTTQLRQVIVMSGPVDTSVGRSPTPPSASGQGTKVTLIGIAGNDAVIKNLEPFFGTPVTPDSEKRLIEAVKTDIAGKGMDVRIAGWWPEEGVMAVSVVPKGS